MKRIFLLLALVVLTGCSLSDDATPPPALATAQALQPGQVATSNPAGVPPVAPSGGQLEPPDTNPDIESGEAVYLDKCIQCHGPGAMGDGDMASNLDSPPPPLGEIEVARQAVPAGWYTVVTQGRMEMFMPPFSSLSDQERWDVTGYLLSLGLEAEDLETGESLFAANCAQCHVGDEAVGGLLEDPALLAASSRQHVYETIESGVEGMPGFGDELTQDEIWALAAYVQNINLGGQPSAPTDTDALPTGEVSETEAVTETETIDQPAEGTPSTEATGEGEPTQTTAEDTPVPTETLVGVIEGQVVQGTSDAGMPEGLTAQLLGLEGNAVVVDEEAPVGTDGSFRFEDLEAIPGRLYAVVVEYEGVPYFSEGVHLLAGEPVSDLPVVIHETTLDTDQLLVDRVHLIADPTQTGGVIITELWLVVNVGDRTIFNPGGPSLQVRLPDGFTDLEFFDESAQLRFFENQAGFVYTGSFVPGYENEIVFSFSLEFDDRLDFEQPMDFPVGAVVALVPEGLLAISGEGVVDRGVQDMGGTMLHTYNLPSGGAGQAIEFRLRSSGSSGVGSNNSGLIVGLAVLGAGLVAAGVLWYRQSQSGPEPQTTAEPAKASIKRDHLLRQIADLDDAFEAGEIDPASYEKQRARLKEEVRRLMQDEG